VLEWAEEYYKPSKHKSQFPPHTIKTITMCLNKSTKMDKGMEKTLISESPPLLVPIHNHSIQFCYIIPKKWWDHWCKYVGYQQPETESRPEKIDNSKISLSDDNIDCYIFLTKLNWTRFKNWYQAKPKLKVFLVNGFPQCTQITIHIKIPMSQNFIVNVPLTITLFKFREYVLKKAKQSGDFTIVTKNLMGTKKTHEKMHHILREEGFYDGVIVKFVYKRAEGQIPYGEYPKIVISDFENINIAEEDDEDEELQKALKVSMDEATKGTEVEMVDFGISNKLSEARSVICVKSSEKKTTLVVHSLLSILTSIDNLLLDPNLIN